MTVGELKRIIEDLSDETLIVAPDIENDDGFSGIYVKEVKVDYGKKDHQGNYHYNEDSSGLDALCITTQNNKRHGGF